MYFNGFSETYIRTTYSMLKIITQKYSNTFKNSLVAGEFSGRVSNEKETSESKIKTWIE